MKSFLLFILHLYRRLVSPLLPASCRFYPSCSEYAAEAINHYGAGKGLFFALRRLLRCHPFCTGGFDPVLPPTLPPPPGGRR
ncbi:MAG: membrane protein insertion efficiency factor YidD [Candidatus Omnitrophica bacterium]|nr:membrane protein insertion efficiency factor YidD [Candidatus Omnitrophota bacterium]